MFKKRKVYLLFTLFVVIFLIILIVLMRMLPSTESKVTMKRTEEIILEEVQQLSNFYKTRKAINNTVVESFINEVNQAVLSKGSAEYPLIIENIWMSKTKLNYLNGSYLGTIIHALKNNKILKADVDKRGTQLKLLLTLTGNVTAIFKPKWYEKENIIEGPVYAGKDRFNSEIIAFYLSLILQKPLVPISTVRKLSLQKEIVPVATEILRDTIFVKNGTTCVYGKCFYCTEKDPVCEENGFLMGAVILNINAPFKIYKSPWRRTYKKGKKAPWELDDHYCQIVEKKLSEERILNLVDISIFDFLIQNGDRHRYETLHDTILYVDNGKGLGNPFKDHIDILAPLYQCCRLNRNTWNTLLRLSGGRIKDYLLKMPNINEIITKNNLDAIERRLVIVYSAVQFCKKRNQLKLL